MQKIELYYYSSYEVIIKNVGLGKYGYTISNSMIPVPDKYCIDNINDSLAINEIQNEIIKDNLPHMVLNLQTIRISKKLYDKLNKILCN